MTDPLQLRSENAPKCGPSTRRFPCAVHGWAVGRFLRRACAVGTAAVWLAACTSTPVVEVPEPTTRWFGAPWPGDFPGAPTLLRGFSAPEVPRWMPGDAALFALEWTSEGQRDGLLLHLEVLEPRCTVQTDEGPRPAQRPIELEIEGATWSMQSDLASVQVRVHEPDGSLVGESVVRVPRTALDHGFHRACRHVRRTGRGIRTNEPVDDVYLEAVSSLLALFAIVSSDPVLGDVFWSIVEPPSTWSVLANLGVSVSISPYFSRCTPILERPGHLPQEGNAYAVPFVIEVNEAPALRAELLVTEPRPPLHLCGGIAGIHATHPTDPGIEMSMVLLAARCGPAVRTGMGPAFGDAAK